MARNLKSEISKDNLLRSWKEISSHLGCGVRTCYRWEEKHGMPVHRAEQGENRSSVFAFRDELDEWFNRTFKNSNETERKLKKRRLALRWAAAGAAGLIVAGTVLGVLASRVRRQPADFAIEGQVFIALDKQKRELWRKNTGAENLRTEEMYRRRFQVKSVDDGDVPPWLVMRDINDDGDTEVLFALKRVGDRFGEGLLTCYDRAGVKLWELRTDRELVSPKKRFSSDYRILGLEVRDLDGDRKFETVVIFWHAPDWPSRLVVVDSAGRNIGEFWNAGYMRGPTFVDINGDGREEMIVGAVNNEYRGGVLAVFDTRNISGGSPQSGDFVCEGIGPGSMLYYVTTPCTEAAGAVGYVDDIRNLFITSNGWIQAVTGAGLIFDFDLGFKCVQASWGHNYTLGHEDGVRSGKAWAPLDDAFRKRVVDGVRYWNGAAWTAEPAMVTKIHSPKARG